jgi:hypothetical protein
MTINLLARGTTFVTGSGIVTGMTAGPKDR